MTIHITKDLTKDNKTKDYYALLFRPATHRSANFQPQDDELSKGPGIQVA